MLHPYRYFGLITVELCAGSSCGRLLWRVRDAPCEGKMSTFRHDLKNVVTITTSTDDELLLEFFVRSDYIS